MRQEGFGQGFGPEIVDGESPFDALCGETELGKFRPGIVEDPADPFSLET